MPRTGTRNRSSLRTSLGIVGCTFASLVVFAVVLSGLMLVSWDRAVVDRGDLRIASDEVSDLRLAYSDQETGIRGYLLARDARFLEPYRDGTGLARVMVQRLRSNTATEQIGIDAQLDRVEQVANRWRDDVALVALDATAPPPDDELGRIRFEAIRVELDRLDAIVTAELDRLVERTADLKQNTFGVLIASALAAVGAIMLVAMLFRRWVMQPLALISQSARQLSVDDGFVLPDFDSVELWDVTEAIRTLQHSLEHERDRALIAYRGLEQSAFLATRVRAELANELGEPPAGWSVDSALVPAEGLVAGDSYDLGLLDQRRLYVIMVDVTGHGAVAALDALKAKSHLRAALRGRLSPGAALDWLSRENQNDDHADLLTAFVALIDVETGACQYANAGHPAPLLTNGVDDFALGTTGPLLGAFETAWRTDSVTIDPGWTLVLYTDGITEALGADRERFGDDRLVECLHSSDITETHALINDVLDAVDVFRVGSRTDDLTVLALHHIATPVVPPNHPSFAGLDTVKL